MCRRTSSRVARSPHRWVGDGPSSVRLRDALQAVNAARACFNRRVTTSLAWRKRQLRALFRYITDYESALVEAVHVDINKPRSETVAAELGVCINEIAYMLDNLDRLAGLQPVPGDISSPLARTAVRREPYGVVLIIGAVRTGSYAAPGAHRAGALTRAPRRSRALAEDSSTSRSSCLWCP